MLRVTRRVATGAAIFVGVCGAASAGPDWIEGGDAGSAPGTAQVAAVAELRSIAGRLDGTEITFDRGDGDFEDVYLIEIKSISEFFAETDGFDGGSSQFDSLLCLFDLDGNAIIANMESPLLKDRGGEVSRGGGVLGSRLQANSTDGTGAVIPGPGFYYLAICGRGNFPRDSMQLPLFDFDSFGEISGPDGAGEKNDGMLSGWEGEGQTGNYLIFLDGVCGIVNAPVAAPLMSPVGLAGFVGLTAVCGAFALRRRDDGVSVAG